MTNSTEDLPEGPTAHSGRMRLAVWTAIVVVGLALGGGGVLLLSSGGSSGDVMALERRPPEGKYESFDALVLEAEETSMTLLTRDGERDVLHIRKPDRPLIDVQHAQSHAALGQPVRVFWAKIDGKRSIVYLEDSPVMFR